MLGSNAAKAFCSFVRKQKKKVRTFTPKQKQIEQQ